MLTILNKEVVAVRAFDFEQRWAELYMEVVTGMAEWRQQHPQATFMEIEAGLDERLNRTRAKMLADVALASQAADWREAEAAKKPVCAKCGAKVQSRGEKVRRLRTRGGEEVVLKRHHAVCPECGQAFFPPG
jgi:hypothetical protein